ncbi:hypothetical protein [Streptomyces sp. NPDC005141]
MHSPADNVSRASIRPSRASTPYAVERAACATGRSVTGAFPARKAFHQASP